MPLQTHPRSRTRSRPTRRPRQDPAPPVAPPADEIQRLDIDLPVLASAFSQRLHEADLPVSPAQSEQYAFSLRLISPSSLRRLYFTTRAVFLTEPEQTATFDRIFEEVFGARVGRDANDEGTIETTIGAATA